MQLHLTFTGDSIILPVNNRPLIHGLIYQGLSGDEQVFHQIHDAQPAAGDRFFKGFTFSDLRGQFTFRERFLAYDKSVSLEIRSLNPILIALLYHYFSVVSEVRLGDTLLQVSECRMTDEHIHRDRIMVRTAAPIIVYLTEGRYTRFFSPADDSFYGLIIRNAKRKAAQFNLEELFDFSIAPAQAVIPRKQLSSFKGTILEGWYGDFVLQGHPYILDMLYQTGIGVKNPEGYGMFEVRA